MYSNNWNEIKATNHAYERLKERKGFKGDKKHADDYVKKAFRHGVHLMDLEPEEKSKIKLRIKHNTPEGFRVGKVTVYQRGVFIFTKYNKCLTVLKYEN